MFIKNLIKNLFTSKMPYSDSVSYRRIIMINSMLILAIIVFFIFTYTNLFVIYDPIIALMDFLSALASIYALYRLRKNRNVPQAAFISVVVLIVFMISFTLKNENSHFGVIWSVFIPYFAILFNGKKIGLMLATFFYTVMIYLSFKGIGHWNEGAWEFIDFLRFTMSAVVLTYIIYMVEAAHEKADEELKKVRKHEEAILEELKNKAITDTLTGMYNRRYFKETIPKILKIAQRDEKYVSFFILDIDYFKNYNDYYGHQAGDEALKKVANALQSFLQRENDFVFRIGGEEFTGIVHIDRREEGKEWISKLNDYILNLGIEHLGSQLAAKKLTVSIGLCSKLVTQETDLEYFYKLADAALYSAKESGRNRLVACS